MKRTSCIYVILYNSFSCYLYSIVQALSHFAPTGESILTKIENFSKSQQNHAYCSVFTPASLRLYVANKQLNSISLPFLHILNNCKRKNQPSRPQACTMGCCFGQSSPSKRLLSHGRGITRCQTSFVCRYLPLGLPSVWNGKLKLQTRASLSDSVLFFAQ